MPTGSSSEFGPKLVDDMLSAYLDRKDRGEPIPFEQYCAEHPEFAAALRERLGGAATLRDADGVAHSSLAKRLEAALGPQPVPAITLDRNAEGDRTPELLEALESRREPASRYHVKNQIARGGMGTILRVWDSDLRRHLAMKVMANDDEPSPSRLARFLEEAQVTGQLDHPGIVPVHELGIDASGRVFFTMKLVKGITLAQVFDHVAAGEDGWTTTRALGVVLRVCEAMAFAHAKGVIHRDLKPANVMVGRFGETYVMDWGLARVLGDRETKDIRLRASESASAVRTQRRDVAHATPDSPLLTMDGDQVGTPAYMPPEQARGQLDRIGPHSDVYAVGAMLYHLVTGQVPYVRDCPEVSAPAILDAVLAGPPPPVTEFGRRLDPNLVTIVERAMARDVARRYATMTELADALRAFLEGRVDAPEASLFEMSHLPPSLVFRYVATLIATLGAWIASTTAWEAMGTVGRTTYIVATVGLLFAVGGLIWRGQHRRSAVALLAGALLAMPCAVFALLHLAPGFDAVEVGDVTRVLDWSVLDEKGFWKPRPDLSGQPAEKDLLRAAMQDRFDLKLLLVFIATLAAAVGVHRATRAALFPWVVVVLAIASWQVVLLVFGAREIAAHHRLEWSWGPAIVCAWVGVQLERRGDSAYSRPLMAIGFIVWAAFWSSYADSEYPARYLDALTKPERLAACFALGGGMALGIAYFAQRSGNQLLSRYATLPYLVAPAAILLSLCSLVAKGTNKDYAVSTYEVLLPLACLAFVALSILLQRKNLLYAGAIYLVIAVTLISNNHFRDEWTWPIVLSGVAIVIGAASWLLRRWDDHVVKQIAADA
ncbi:MAG: protein kinase [Planctomycetes bacterium]|nr:protein kinase [Planctomycetota bacterium]